MLARSSAVSWGVRFAEEVQCRRTDRPCHRLAAGQPRVFRHRAERHHRSRRGAERLALSLFPRGQAADRQRRDRLRRRRGGVLPRPRRDPGPHARNVLRQFTATLRGWLEHSRFEEACPVLSTSLSIDAELAPVHAECRRALRAWHASIERALRADGLAEKLAASRAWLILAALEGGRGGPRRAVVPGAGCDRGRIAGATAGLGGCRAQAGQVSVSAARCPPRSLRRKLRGRPCGAWPGRSGSGRPGRRRRTRRTAIARRMPATMPAGWR